MAKDLWKKGSLEDWQQALENHQKAIDHLNNEKLTELESWFQEQLPAALSSKEPCQMEKDELVKLVDWKLTRGKWRPNLLKFAQQQQEGAVEAASKDAFADLDDTPQAAKAALASLSSLKGVGPATASAALSAACADIPFMSDEALEAVVGGRDYTAKAFGTFLEGIRRKVGTLREQSGRTWTAREVERALWAAAVLAGESRVKSKAAGGTKRATAAAVSTSSTTKKRKR